MDSPIIALEEALVALNNASRTGNAMELQRAEARIKATLDMLKAVEAQPQG